MREGKPRKDNSNEALPDCRFHTDCTFEGLTPPNLKDNYGSLHISHDKSRKRPCVGRIAPIRKDPRLSPSRSRFCK